MYYERKSYPQDPHENRLQPIKEVKRAGPIVELVDNFFYIINNKGNIFYEQT